MVDRVGQQLGNYQLIRFLGEGGFAEVYLGEHIHLGTHAAIKMLQTQLTSDDLDRFRTEARTVARLLHPNIVRILEFGVEGKTPFLVMDYAPNGTLRQRHSSGTPLPLTTVVSYVKQIADALQYAHDERLIHRDIKPENMLLGRRHEVLLSDFGIATVAQSTRYQGTQDMAGTIAYMAPEQIQAHPRPASDQYSLGIVVYEWLTGDRPFHGSFTEIAIKHSVTPPAPLREKIPTLSPDVEHVVMTALAKEPKERFGSIFAFANALSQAHQSDVPTFVNLYTPTILSSPPALPSSPLTESPASPSLPPTQAVASSKPVGTVVQTYYGHRNKVNAVAWSHDGARLASASNDQTVQLWSVNTGQNIYTYRGHPTRVNAVAWSPGDQRIASGSNDQIVQVWESLTNRKVFSFQVHSGQWVWVRTVAWSPDGTRLVVGVEDKTAQVWSAGSGRKLFTYEKHSGPVTTIAWSPDGKSIASGSSDSSVHVWQVHTESTSLVYSKHAHSLFSVAWSPDGKHIASGGHDKSVQVWDAATGATLLTYGGHSRYVNTLAWSPDGKWIASGSTDGIVQVWEVTSGKDIFSYRGHADAVNAVAWSPTRKYIASASDDKTVQVWAAP